MGTRADRLIIGRIRLRVAEERHLVNVNAMAIM
jgi:hypothetical protein